MLKYIIPVILISSSLFSAQVPVSPKTDIATAEKNLFHLIDSMKNLDEKERNDAVRNYLNEISVDSVYFNDIINMADMALADPESDRFDEDLLTVFMQNALTSRLIGESEKDRVLWRLEAASKNRPGTKASDFKMSVSNNIDTNLWSLASNKNILLLFYDPDCDHCSEVIGEMKRDCVEKKYDIIAVDISGDRDLWENTRQCIPSSWISAFALDNLEDDEIYIFSKMPSVYILAPDKTVIDKNAKSL